MNSELPAWLTTSELAELLRIKERKVYDLASSGAVPCSRATGKLLFPRDQINTWLRNHSAGNAGPAHEVSQVFLGSHDPLLEWALRESACGIPTLFESSVQGLERFALREGLACGLHIYDEQQRDWNTPLVAKQFATEPVVLLEWTRRERGLVIAKNVASPMASLLSQSKAYAMHELLFEIQKNNSLTWVPRQPGAGSQQLLKYLLAKEGVDVSSIQFTAQALTESAAVQRVFEGKAGVTFGLRSMAEQYGLAFFPFITERYDLLMDRRTWFEPSVQRLFSFSRSKEFIGYAEQLGGYDISSLGRVHFNGL